ncbi:MAG: ABC transporter permease [Methylococcaceae bacterium]|nr:ABC transporter permease [Methylococcaceae bacterium]
MIARYWLDLAQQSAWGLRDNLRRSVLSMIGVAIGIAAVIVIAAIGKGGQLYVLSELETFGLRSVWIYRDYQSVDPRRSIRQGTGIENEDYQLILEGCCPSIKLASPVLSARAFRGYGESHPQFPIRNGNRYSNARLEGVAESFLSINQDQLASGRNFLPGESTQGRAVALLSRQTAMELFADVSKALGKRFRIRNESFIAIGILQDKNRNLLGSAGVVSDNHRILIPYPAYQRLLGRGEISRLQLEAVSQEKTTEALREARDLLARRHRGQYAYAGETMTQHIATADRILNAVKTVGVVSALASLLVGGLGITSIMYTSVIERTREIGLRLAIGAERADILLQFLLEAALISLFGGLAGLWVGVCASIWLAHWSGFPLAPDWKIIGGGMIVSVGLGLTAGFLPARRAARLQPVRALRYE